MARGRYRIFIGMAAGVGKTYRMLQEGRYEQEAGRDVVIGLLETHGRAATAEQARGLELLPRRRIVYRDLPMEEMDLPGILRRAPELCLIDELAHTNVPGTEHAKRYEDIADVLDAGIDVLSTLNVQHLESLNDRVAEFSGIRVRETVPDSALTTADEIVLVDITPETLVERLREGNVYPPERIDTALANFFRLANLTTLREIALREVAEQVGAKQLAGDVAGRGRDGAAGEAAQRIGEHVLALIRPDPGAQRLVRRAWRSAQRLGAELDLLWVRRPGLRPSEDEERSLRALQQLAGLLGTRLLVRESDDVAETIAEVARERGTTYLLLGRETPRRGLARLRTPLPQRLMELLPGVDVRIVADRTRRRDVPG
jgi:two-component system, OmpR family, sensor histidine kinase KdpD